MQTNPKIESGLQLFSRLHHRPSLKNLNPALLPDFPSPNEYVEISGDLKCGKNLLMLDFVARCLLPSQYKGIQVEGKNCGAIVINTNHQFDLFELIDIMERILKHSCKKVVQLSIDSVQSVIKSCLNNLIILNCYDSVQFQVTLLNLENLLTDNMNISLVVLDNISSYYWEYRSKCGVIGLQAYHLKVLCDLQNSVQNLNVTVIYTINEGDVKYMNSFYKTNTVCRIMLEQIDDKFRAHVFHKNVNKVVTFTVDKRIKFVNSWLCK